MTAGNKERVDLVATVGVNVVTLLLGLLTGVMTARLLTPDDRGVLVGTVLWVGLFASLALLGLDEAVVYVARGDRALAYGLASHFRVRAAGQGLVGGLSAAAFVYLWVVDEADGRVLITAVAILTVMLNCVLLMNLAPLRVADRTMTWNLLRLIVPGLYAAGVVALALVGSFSLEAAVGALFLANLVSVASSWLAVISRRLRSPAPAQVTRSRRYGARLSLTFVPLHLNQRLDQLLLGAFFAPGILGVYAVAVSIAGALQAVGVALEQVLFPRLASGSLARRDLVRIAIIGSLGVGVLGFLLAVPAESVIEAVYGQEYVGAATALRVLVVGAVFLTGVHALTAEAKADGRTRDIFLAQSIGVIVTLAVLPLAVRESTIAGAAVTSTLSYATTLGWLIKSRRADGIGKQSMLWSDMPDERQR